MRARYLIAAIAAAGASRCHADPLDRLEVDREAGAQRMFAPLATPRAVARDGGAV